MADRPILPAAAKAAIERMLLSILCETRAAQNSALAADPAEHPGLDTGAERRVRLEVSVE